MNKYTRVVCAISLVLLPAGVILADQGQRDQRDRERDDDYRTIASTTIRFENDRYASSTLRLSGEKREMFRHVGTTTPSGIDKKHGSTTDDNDSEHGNSKERGEGNFGIKAMLQWIFGQPGSTTVQQLHDQIFASSTASTTPFINHEGFLKRILRIFDGWFNK